MYKVRSNSLSHYFSDSKIYCRFILIHILLRISNLCKVPKIKNQIFVNTKKRLHRVRAIALPHCSLDSKLLFYKIPENLITQNVKIQVSVCSFDKILTETNKFNKKVTICRLEKDIY